MRRQANENAKLGVSPEQTSLSSLLLLLLLPQPPPPPPPPPLTAIVFLPSGSSPYTSTNISYTVKSKFLLQKNEQPLYGETANR